MAKKRRVVDEVEEECTSQRHHDTTFHGILTNFVDWDMAFPDDEREANPASFKFLEMAHKWKRAQASGGGGLLAGLSSSGPDQSTTETSSATQQNARNGDDDGSDED